VKLSANKWGDIKLDIKIIETKSLIASI